MYVSSLPEMTLCQKLFNIPAGCIELPFSIRKFHGNFVSGEEIINFKPKNIF
jgi:hypothetical protein